MADDLLLRFEASHLAIAEKNSALLARASAIAAASKQTSFRCESCAAGWHQLQAELAALPQAIAELSGGVAAACARAEALEHRLREATVARVQRREALWRQSKLREAKEAEAAVHEAASRAAAREAAAAAAAVEDARRAEERARRTEAAEAEARRIAEERERQAIFDAEFQAQRNEYLRSREEENRQPTPPISAALLGALAPHGVPANALGPGATLALAAKAQSAGLTNAAIALQAEARAAEVAAEEAALTRELANARVRAREAEGGAAASLAEVAVPTSLISRQIELEAFYEDDDEDEPVASRAPPPLPPPPPPPPPVAPVAPSADAGAVASTVLPPEEDDEVVD